MEREEESKGKNDLGRKCAKKGKRNKIEQERERERQI